MAHIGNHTAAKFLFAIVQNTEVETTFTGIPYRIFVTSKDYFVKHHQIQTTYNKHEAATLVLICDKYALNETFESCYYCTTHTAEEITQRLEAEPSFEYSNALEQFIKDLRRQQQAEALAALQSDDENSHG